MSEPTPTPETIIDSFIDRLFTHLERRGIDTTNWDGDDDPETIIANGIEQRLTESQAENARLQRDLISLASERATLRTQVEHNEQEIERFRAQVASLTAELKGMDDHCPKCGSELRYCGEQDPVTHVPAIECRLCQLAAERDQLRAELDELLQYFDIKQGTLADAMKPRPQIDSGANPA